MTVISYKEDSRHCKYRIEAKGHATGSQDVCTAISMLMCTLASYVAETGDFRLDPGNSWVEWYGSREPFDMIRGGLELLATRYPEYVKIA